MREETFNMTQQEMKKLRVIDSVLEKIWELITRVCGIGLQKKK